MSTNSYLAHKTRMDTEKKAMTGRMCPISPNLPTRMTRDGFIRACKRTRAGGRWNIETEHWACPTCSTGKHIDEGAFFVPPPNIRFATLAEFQEPMLEVYAKQIKLRREAGMNPVLTPEIVIFIRDWYKRTPDMTITKRAEILGISRRQMSRIIKGERWKL